MRPRWFYLRCESRLWDRGTLGYVARLTRHGGWNAYARDYIGNYPTRAAAMRAVTSATDPKKGHFPRGEYGTLQFTV